MGLNLFGVNSVERIVDVPRGYTRKVKWLPQIGDIFPNFRAETTMGPISFHPWAEGNWVMLFSPWVKADRTHRRFGAKVWKNRSEERRVGKECVP